MKCQCTIFMLGWARSGFHNKRAGTCYVEHMFLHLVGSVGHIVILVCPTFETSAHYFSCSGAPIAAPIKGMPGHVMVNLCFCI
jgi:hypothetical protein